MFAIRFILLIVILSVVAAFQNAGGKLIAQKSFADCPIANAHFFQSLTHFPNYTHNIA